MQNGRHGKKSSVSSLQIKDAVFPECILNDINREAIKDTDLMI